ncbi:sigma 54-interacting transcriptional regulator [Fusibacter ferrireducens]|uniref:Sigma 54-interacting transcriptional regulator n=1 Tax=Fusibacter ferrireducens TaxID=2785058 RepID=A0ABS0A0U9_9FIRM|nr:sigma 54-interacting transcriptional regulator [Fusibacter ferrireducens]MBF4695775.1 sigma 54-interacting transcriptional regulator [Fusibacter ferrireducens]
MLDRIQAVLVNENPRQPYTDEKIAEVMHIRRERVIELRKTLGIPDSRERLKSKLITECKVLISKEPSISVRALTTLLNSMGYDISRHLVKLVRDELMQRAPEISLKSNMSQRTTGPDGDGFENMIGWNGGLLTQVNQAKAAIAYPPNGLSTLIIGPSGTGKTLLAENMYRFAVKKKFLKEDAPFIAFNCADYADNPQLLISQLFGHVKGAYSGAVEDKKGLVESADNGILFLDEVHRLPSEGQELLFYLLDKGEYRRLGDSNNTRSVNVRLIAATTNSPESSLLLTFRRRIPMVIMIPAITARPLRERYAIIRQFFIEETEKLNRRVVIEGDAIKILLQYHCFGNVGQLRSDIQVCCAESFLRCLVENLDEIRITAELLEKLKIDIDSWAMNDIELNHLSRELILDPLYENSKWHDEELSESSQVTIYQEIQSALDEMVKNGVDDEESLHLVRMKIDAQLRTLRSGIKDMRTVAKENIWDSIVNKSTMKAVEHALESVQAQFPEMEPNLKGVLSIHIDAVINALSVGNYIRNADLGSVRQNFPEEYAVAVLMLRQISKALNLDIPNEEAIIIAMYLKAYSSKQSGGRIRVVVLTHGQVGKAMADVANKMLDVNNAVGISMDLNESSDVAFERVCDLISHIDEGQGCILLVDMGSLVSFGQKITERTGIQVRCVARVDTLMVLDALRRANLGEEYTVDALAQALEAGRLYGISATGISRGKPPVLITMCITGEGNARSIRTLLETSFPGLKGNIEIIEMGLFNRNELLEKVNKIKSTKEILAIIGTINPDLSNVPFFSLNYVLTGHGTLALTNLLSQNAIIKHSLADLTSPALILWHPKVSSKNEIIDQLTAQLVSEAFVKDAFLLSVYKRENLGDTCLNMGIAIPHGDAAQVNRPAIAVAKLEHSIDWAAGIAVDFVFLFAFDENCAKYVEIFYEKTRNENWLECLKKTETKEEILNLLRM